MVSLLFFLPAVPCQNVVVVTSDQFDKYGWFLPITSAASFPSYLVHCAHCVERQSNIRNNIQKHFLKKFTMQRRLSGIRQCCLFKSSPAVTIGSVYTQRCCTPTCLFDFKSLEEDRCARALHPEHDVRVFCQVSLLSCQWLVSAVQRLEHVLRS